MKIIDLLTKTKALQYGNFTLTSGKTSNYYFDAKALTLDCQGLGIISKLLATKIRQNCPEVDCIGGVELGSVVILGGVLKHYADMLEMLGEENHIKGFIIRKDTKEHGLKKLIEGNLSTEKTHNVCILEDVTTTGQSVLKAANLISNQGHVVRLILSIFDREEGAKELLGNSGYRFDALLTKSMVA